MVWHLETRLPDGHEVSFELTRAVLAQHEVGAHMGRSGALSHILLPDESISRRHARLFEKNGTLFLEDLDFSNGTYVRNRKLKAFQACPLSDGDTIRLGDVTLSLRAPAGPAARQDA